MKRFLSPLVFLPLFLTVATHGVEIIGHRGASHDAPENTVASFKLGWEQHADADELDIYLSKDGQVVVMHDASTKRTTGVDKKIADSTLAELRELDAGSLKGEQWKGEKIPTLSEALATIPEGKRMFIEIKCGPEVLPALETVMKASGCKPEQMVIIGFSHPVMQQARQRFAQAPIYWIVSPKADKESGLFPPIESLIAKAKDAGLSGLDLDAKYPLDAAAVAKVKEAGLRLYTWTVDDSALAQKLAAAGVDGVTTNRPGWLREQLK
ncbi:MAG: glycerophosphodiester phosphodiesterase [Chthoniobacter sp.]